MTSHARKTIGTKPAPAKKSRFAFFNEVVAELRKAHWPSRNEAIRLSLLVLVVCTVLGAVLGALDYGFYRLFLLIGG
jgi:preprotein translocase subunit SecE